MRGGMGWDASEKTSFIRFLLLTPCLMDVKKLPRLGSGHAIKRLARKEAETYMNRPGERTRKEQRKGT